MLPLLLDHVKILYGDMLVMQKRIVFTSFLGIILFALTFSVLSIPSASAAGTLTNVIVEPSNNLFSLESHYVVGFTAGTTGTIKTVNITFPAGFNIANANLILVSGIGAGGISVAGQTVTYTINSAVSVPAGTSIMIDLGKIVSNAIASNTLSITTKDTLNNIIDGPTTSPAFTLKPVSAAMLGASSVSNSRIANGAVTNTKILNNSINGTQIIDGSLSNADIATNAAISLSKLATGALPGTITINSANIADGSITGADVASGISLTGSASIDSPTFSIDSNNHRVGIGTTTPSHKLELLTSDSDVANFASTGDGARLLVNVKISDPNSFAGIGYQMGGIPLWFDGIDGDSATGKDYTIFNYQGGGRVFTIDGNTNNVGIGTTNPTQRLQVSPTDNDGGILIYGTGSTGVRLRMESHANTGRNYDLVSTDQGSGFGTGKFLINDRTTGDAPRFAIDSLGNVGIGTWNPAEKLQVAGNIAWNGGSSASQSDILSSDQGGSIELGNSLQAGSTPYIDFHYGLGSGQDYNMRIINDGYGQLTIKGTIPLGSELVSPTLRLLNTDLVATSDGNLGGNIYAARTLITDGAIGIGTFDPTTKLQLSSGDISDKGAGNGLILKSPGNNCFKITVSNTGAVTSTSVTCPV